ncbi:hypothetical protein VTK73DRAFT_5976 [Phialemonium thermophilum]|uniref:Uncharacterized protein n=1 Tax=Phialemonium thermophilum TaxID=223376 RepID=A0ABR3WLE1_9PEZI
MTRMEDNKTDPQVISVKELPPSGDDSLPQVPQQHHQDKAEDPQEQFSDFSRVAVADYSHVQYFQPSDSDSDEDEESDEDDDDDDGLEHETCLPSAQLQWKRKPAMILTEEAMQAPLGTA